MSEISAERIERAALAIAEHDCGLLQFAKCAEDVRGCICRDEARSALTADAPALAEAERRGRIAELTVVKRIAGTGHFKTNPETIGDGVLFHVREVCAAISARISALEAETPTNREEGS